MSHLLPPMGVKLKNLFSMIILRTSPSVASRVQVNLLCSRMLPCCSSSLPTAVLAFLGLFFSRLKRVDGCDPLVVVNIAVAIRVSTSGVW